VHFPFTPSQRLPLRSRQIYYLQFAEDGVVWVASVDLLHSHAENRVRPARVHIHSMAANNLILDSMVEQGDYVIVT
jgi:hypothetical protein